MDSHLFTTGMSALAQIDQDIAEAYGELGPPPPRNSPPGFETLFSITNNLRRAQLLAQKD